MFPFRAATHAVLCSHRGCQAVRWCVRGRRGLQVLREKLGAAQQLRGRMVDAAKGRRICLFACFFNFSRLGLHPPKELPVLPLKRCGCHTRDVIALSSAERPASVLTLTWEAEKRMNRISDTLLVAQVKFVQKVQGRFPEAGQRAKNWHEVSRWRAGWPPIVLLWTKAYFCLLARMANFREILSFSFSYFIIK